MMANSVERKCPVCLKVKTIYINGICDECNKKIKDNQEDNNKSFLDKTLI
jgi:hypothetical protein